MQLAISYIVFTLCIVYIIFYWTIAISNGVSYLWQMMHTRAAEDVELYIPNGCVCLGRGHGQVPCGNPSTPPRPHPPVSIEQLLATQNELMGVLVQNEERRGPKHPHYPQH
jgi:hypothetical protein